MYALMLLIVILIFLVMNKKHFLITLLLLESIMIIVLFVFFLCQLKFDLYYFLIFITLSACEGALGLSILINLTRGYSSDYFLMFNSVI